ncbi:hypothetical protein C2G38_396475 [Gigaspora rosea]|uniref:FHA domain-containing protein n=1 Tax=Gigaspora rosea TaxID=44941 RepID=A0A397UGA7_9GLOM|nr:hypothetical protein C2G38_396475 [Gigaspora rosea]
MDIFSIRYANGYTPSFHQKAAATTAMSSTKYSITNTTKRTPSKSYSAPVIPTFIKQTVILDSLNETFSTKRLSLTEGIPVKIGRSTNKQTSPAETNGYFDSKVLSRTHAEVWFENGKVLNFIYGSETGLFYGITVL